MAAAAENFKATAIANLKEEAEIMGWAKDSEVYKSKFLAIVAEAEAMATAAAAPPVVEQAKAKRQDPPWKDKWEDFTCKGFDAALKMLQQVQKGEWQKDHPHYGYRHDEEKNKCNTKRWVSPDGKTLVRVTEWVAPKDMAMGHYDLQECPSNYRETLVANKEAKLAEKEAKKAERAAKKEAKLKKAADKAAKAEAKAAEEGEKDGEKEGDKGKKDEKVQEEHLSPRAARGAARQDAQLERGKKEAEEKKAAGVQPRNIKTKAQAAMEKAAAPAAPAAGSAGKGGKQTGKQVQSPPSAAAGKPRRTLTKEEGKALKARALAAERAKTKNAKERAAAAKEKKAKEEKAKAEQQGKNLGKRGASRDSGEGASESIAATRTKRHKVTNE